MARMVYLHAGTHKTGTTSIQSYLSDHRKPLRRSGLHFIEERVARNPGLAPIRHRNSSYFAHAFIREELMSGTRWRAGDLSKVERKAADAVASVEALLRASTSSRFVISTEAFCLLRTEEERERLRAFFASLDCQVKPVIVLRNEADWRASFTAQLAKSSYADCHATVTDPARRVDSDWYYDAAGIVAFWSGFAPPAVINYDEAMRERGSIIPAFFEAIGMELPGDYQAYTLNTRLATDPADT